MRCIDIEATSTPPFTELTLHKANKPRMMVPTSTQPTQYGTTDRLDIEAFLYGVCANVNCGGGISVISDERERDPIAMDSILRFGKKAEDPKKKQQQKENQHGNASKLPRTVEDTLAKVRLVLDGSLLTS